MLEDYSTLQEYIITGSFMRENKIVLQHKKGGEALLPERTAVFPSHMIIFHAIIRACHNPTFLAKKSMIKVQEQLSFIRNCLEKWGTR